MVLIPISKFTLIRRLKKQRSPWSHFTWWSKNFQTSLPACPGKPAGCWDFPTWKLVASLFPRFKIVSTSSFLYAGGPEPTVWRQWQPSQRNSCWWRLHRPSQFLRLLFKFKHQALGARPGHDRRTRRRCLPLCLHFQLYLQASFCESRLRFEKET